MWTATTRAEHRRAGLWYGSDVTDTEWALLQPELPAPESCGRHRAWPMRESKGKWGVAVHPRRWVVERFFTWIGRNCRLARDVEAIVASAKAFLYAASAMPSYVGSRVVRRTRPG
jgi:transposase